MSGAPLVSSGEQSGILELPQVHIVLVSVLQPKFLTHQICAFKMHDTIYINT